MDQDKRLGQIDYIATINKAVDNGLVLTKENFTGNSSRIFNEETGKVDTEFLTDPEPRSYIKYIKRKWSCKNIYSWKRLFKLGW